MKKLGIIVENPDDLMPYIGPPLRASFKELHGLSQSESSLAVSYYRERYERKGILENTQYPGVVELLNELNGKGRRLFVATSKPWVYAMRILTHFEMDGYFTSVEGSELDGMRSDKTELIRYVLEKHGLERQATVMVGDRMHDAVGALRNGVDCIGVGYGYGSLRELTEAGATHYCGSVSDLRDLLCSDA